MRAGDEEINELLVTATKLAEVASRRGLTVTSHLLDMLQLELTMAVYGYSDTDDPMPEMKPAELPRRSGSAARSLSRTRRS